MNSITLILILLAGVLLLFVAGSLIAHYTKLKDEYNDMMNKGGNIAKQ